jgi:glycine/D-amino acid oxidase-like deaminating enzyme
MVNTVHTKDSSGASLASTGIRERFDHIVIGGGFYGCRLALALAGSVNRVALLESEAELMTRASYVNQARVHNGYHYPRSYLTALRSAANFPRFVAEFRDCIDNTFEHVYAIARNNSKVSANQFNRFCSLIGAPLRPVPERMRRLFNTDLIEDAFCVTEYAFDAVALRRHLRSKLDDTSVTVLCRTPVDRISSQASGHVSVHLQNGDCLTAGRVFSCTYSSTNDLLRRSGLTPLPFKHELAEVALIAVPEALTAIAVTVMDGPFFSTMPFPPRGLHSLTHVRYTPHYAWRDTSAHTLPALPEAPSPSYVYMVKDAQRYVPALRHSHHEGSLFEVKSVLIQNENDDGRPILFRKDYGMQNFSIVMGSKIDNIYDALNALQAEGLLEATTHGIRS